MRIDADRMIDIVQDCRQHLQAPLERLKQCFCERGIPILNRQDIGRVVLICSSSRGGSSLVFRKLAHSLELLSPRGEQVPFEKLYLPPLEIIGSDFLAGADLDCAMADKIWTCLYFDLGIGVSDRLNLAQDRELYHLALELRLPLQWPGRVYPHDVRRILEQLHPPERRTAGALFVQLVEKLERESKLDSGYYDADPLLDWRLDRSRPAGPPHKVALIEEPPFILILERCWPPAEQIRGLPLLLKSSLNAYHLEFLRQLFPQAHFQIIHLTRNPAATINGLISGWLHWGFFSHNLASLSRELEIRGYSDRFSWGRWWWNFDLPPGWQDFIDAPLERVCAHQWSSAHRHILAFKNAHTDVDYLRVSFEDFIQGPEICRSALEQITDFLSIKPLPVSFNCLADNPIMATEPPRPGRWRQRERLILPVLNDPQVCSIARQLGYDPERRLEWI